MLWGAQNLSPARRHLTIIIFCSEQNGRMSICDSLEIVLNKFHQMHEQKELRHSKINNMRFLPLPWSLRRMISSSNYCLTAKACRQWLLTENSVPLGSFGWSTHFRVCYTWVVLSWTKRDYSSSLDEFLSSKSWRTWRWPAQTDDAACYVYWKSFVGISVGTTEKFGLGRVLIFIWYIIALISNNY